MPATDTLKLAHQQLTTSSSSNQPHPNNTTVKVDLNPRKLMEQFGQYRQQAQQQAQGGVNQVRNWLTQSINNTADVLRHYINQYPPLAAFLFTLLVLSAVPVACFTVFTFVTSAIFLTIALVGFGLAEGLCLMAGGGVLLAVLGGIALVTTIGFSWFALVYVAWKGGYFITQKMMEGGSQLGQKTQEAIQQMQSQTSQPSSSSSSYHPSSSFPGNIPSTSPQQQPM